jgi:hypothetical protein
VRWSWSAVRSLPKRLLFLGLASGLLGGLFGALSIAQGGGLFVGLGVLQLSMPVLMLLWLLNVGLSKGEINTKTTPNEGIHRSARIALGSGLLAGVVGGLLSGLGGRPGRHPAPAA